MRFVVIAGAMFAAGSAPQYAAAQTLTDEQDLACTRIQREWMVSASADASWLEQLYNRTPRYCTDLRNRLEQRIRPSVCAEAGRRWPSVGNSNDPAVVRRYLSETPAMCRLMRGWAQRRLDELAEAR